MQKKSRKIFILDTNVILHDSSCIDQFQEHDIVIPMVVLEELDHFKKGEQMLSYHARHFLRKVDALSGDKLFKGGVPLGPRRGRLTVALGREAHPDLLLSFGMELADHKILNTAYWLARERTDREVILVSKDVNLRVKAKALALKAEDYTTDQVKDVSALYTGKRLIEGAPLDVIEQLYHPPYEVPVTQLPVDSPLMPHEYMILRNGNKSGLATFDPEAGLLRRVDKLTVHNIHPRNAEQIFAFNALLDREVALVTLSGKAGTGKTLLALAAALEVRKHYRQILVARPIVPLSNRDSGFLPGEIEAKLAPYMQPLYDNLGVIRSQFAKADSRYKDLRAMEEGEQLVIAPLSYIRGRSLVGVYFIVDEAQNMTPHEIKTVITRAGEGTKVVFTGDIFQIDHPYLDTQSNGLTYLIEKMRGQRMYAHVNLEKGERSELAELASNIL
jgi:PhoH-like ATPase